MSHYDVNGSSRRVENKLQMSAFSPQKQFLPAKILLKNGQNLHILDGQMSKSKRSKSQMVKNMCNILVTWFGHRYLPELDKEVMVGDLGINLHACI